MATFLTDFSEYTANAQPSDWTERWTTGSFAALVRNSGIPGTPSTGGSHALEIVDSNGSNDVYAISWDDIGTPTGDVQILVLCYAEVASDTSSLLRVFLHGGGAVGSQDAYFFNFSTSATNEVQLRRYANGVFSSAPGDADEGLTRNAWFWVRLDRSGDTIRVRVWEDGTTEPGTWSVSSTDTTHSSGWVGLGLQRVSSSAWFAQVGVGTGGDAAPSSEAITGTIAATLPSFTASSTGAQEQSGAADATLPSLAASLSASHVQEGTTEVTLPSLSGSATGVMHPSGTGDATLPSLTASAEGIGSRNHITTWLPSLTSALQGEQPYEGTVGATLPALSGSGSGSMVLPEGPIAAVLPMLMGSVTAVHTGERNRSYTGTSRWFGRPQQGTA